MLICDDFLQFNENSKHSCESGNFWKRWIEHKKTDKKVSSKFAVCWSTSFQCSSKKSQQAASPKPKKIKLASWLTQTQGDLQVEECWPSRAFDLSRLSLCQKKPCFCWIVLHILRPLALARTGITVALLKVHSERKTYSQYIKYMGKLASHDIFSPKHQICLFNFIWYQPTKTHGFDHSQTSQSRARRGSRKRSARVKTCVATRQSGC